MTDFKELRFRYQVDPKFNEEINVKAKEVFENLDNGFLKDLSHELALLGIATILKKEKINDQ